jgi:hypothetical protein
MSGPASIQGWVLSAVYRLDRVFDIGLEDFVDVGAVRLIARLVVPLTVGELNGRIFFSIGSFHKLIQFAFKRVVGNSHVNDASTDLSV